MKVFSYFEKLAVLSQDRSLTLTSQKMHFAGTFTHCVQVFSFITK